MDDKKTIEEELESLGLQPQEEKPELVIQLAKKVTVQGKKVRYLQVHSGPNRRQRRAKKAKRRQKRKKSGRKKRDTD